MRQRNLKRVVCTSIGVCLIATALVACSSESTGSDSTDSSAPTTEADATTTAAPTTAAAPTTTTTTIAPTTTTAPTVFTLRNDGVGPFDYGAVPDEVIAGLTAQFGAPATDAADSYPNDNGAGFFHDADFAFAYKFPTGRTVCWSNGFCASFGGPEAATYTFTGWRYEADASSTLSTDQGLTIGSRLSEHPEIVEAPYPCFNGAPDPGYDGLTWIGAAAPLLIVALQSEGIPFTMVAGGAGSTPGPIPPSDQLLVKRLAAGDNRVSIVTQCAEGS